MENPHIGFSPHQKVLSEIPSEEDPRFVNLPNIKLFLNNEDLEMTRNRSENKKTPEIKTEIMDISQQFIGGDGAIYYHSSEIVKKENKDFSDSRKMAASQQFSFDSATEEDPHRRGVHLYQSTVVKMVETSPHLSKNLKKHVEGRTNHECNLCDHVPSQKSDLMQHIEEVQTKLKSYKFHSVSEKDNLTNHTTYAVLSNFKCQLCEYTARYEVDLKRHLNSVHSNSKRYMCGSCDFSVNKKEHLKCHINSVHSNLKNKCHICSHTAATKLTLKIHINEVHMKLKKHICHLCDYTATRRNMLKAHIHVVHMNLKEYVCHLCEYAASRKYLLKIHINDVHMNFREHKCNYCDYATNRRYSLNVHIRKVHKYV